MIIKLNETFYIIKENIPLYLKEDLDNYVLNLFSFLNFHENTTVIIKETIGLNYSEKLASFISRNDFTSIIFDLQKENIFIKIHVLFLFPFHFSEKSQTLRKNNLINY